MISSNKQQLTYTRAHIRTFETQHSHIFSEPTLLLLVTASVLFPAAVAHATLTLIAHNNATMITRILNLVTMMAILRKATTKVTTTSSSPAFCSSSTCFNFAPSICCHAFFLFELELFAIPSRSLLELFSTAQSRPNHQGEFDLNILSIPALLTSPFSVLLPHCCLLLVIRNHEQRLLSYPFLYCCSCRNYHLSALFTISHKVAQTRSTFRLFPLPSFYDL